jgi:hypothetical protein
MMVYMSVDSLQIKTFNNTKPNQTTFTFSHIQKELSHQHIESAIHVLLSDPLFTQEVTSVRECLQAFAGEKVENYPGLAKLPIDHDYSCHVRKIVIALLNREEFVIATVLASFILNIQNFKTISHRLVKGNLTKETLSEFEEDIRNLTLLPPYRKTLLKALIPCYEKLNQTEEVTRLKKAVSQLKSFNFFKPTANKVNNTFFQTIGKTFSRIGSALSRAFSCISSG